MRGSDSSARLTAYGWWAAVMLIAGGFLIWTFGELRAATSAQWQDTSGYLAHALYSAEHGGWWGFLREGFAATFPIAERHPLYFLMIAPFASRTADFFWAAKVVNLFTGLAVLLTLIWMVSRRFGRAPALIAGLMYAVSTSLVIASAHVDNEVIFVLCALWTWWFLSEPVAAGTDGARTTPSQQAAADSTPSRYVISQSMVRWALAGVFLGLAYLAKSPALLLGVGVVVAGVWHERLRFITSGRLWVFLAATVVVASPLLVRNIVGFGTPFYEGVNSNIMWIDDWSEVGAEHSIVYYDNYGINTIEKNGMPTVHDYLRTHSVAQISSRLLSGVANEISRVSPRSLMFAVPPSGRLTLLWGFVVLGLAIAGWWMNRQSWDAVLIFFWSGAFVAFFGWDHMFPEIRYLAPLVPIWMAYAAYTSWQILLRLLPSATAFRSVIAGVAACAIGIVAWSAQSGALTRDQVAMDASPSYLRLTDWYNRTIKAGDRVMYGPSREFHGLIWMIDRPIAVINTPRSDSLESFLHYLSERRVRYLVMHAENVDGEGGRLKQALAPYFRASPDGKIVELKRLPGWEPVFKDAGGERFIVYEAQGLAPAPVPALVPLAAS